MQESLSGWAKQQEAALAEDQERINRGSKIIGSAVPELRAGYTSSKRMTNHDRICSYSSVVATSICLQAFAWSSPCSPSNVGATRIRHDRLLSNTPMFACRCRCL